MDWPAAYAAMGETLVAGAPAAAPLLAGFSACVDEVYRLGPPQLEALAVTGGPVFDRLTAGRDGEVFLRDGSFPGPWLGSPVATQIGGTGPQAAWTLAELGAPSVLALADRSAAQLGVLHPDVQLCGEVVPHGEPGKPPHYILEFQAGTRWSGGTVPRSSRIIVRLAEDGVERDPDFAAASPALATRAGAGLVSGLNGVPAGDRASRAWVRDVVHGWRAAGLHPIHLELAEYVPAGTLPALVREYANLVDSVGLSRTELVEFDTGGDPAVGALRIATGFGIRRVVVHADTWSLAVHRGDPARASAALLAGNLLAAARAGAGRPTGEPRVPDGAAFATVLPASRSLGDGWRVDCVPAPYLANPVATIGLGDTFVGGLLLADCLQPLQLETEPTQ